MTDDANDTDPVGASPDTSTVDTSTVEASTVEARTVEASTVEARTVEAGQLGRALRLLSLLQQHRRWTSGELADELGVTTRTVRRDVDRLRLLGYPVEATAGASGGYRLGAGAHLPPLLFDDDEAVALAIGLWAASASPITGIDQTALRALTKVEALLPDRLRRRVRAVSSSTAIHRWSGGDEATDVETLVAVTTACRDREELRFGYVDRAGDESDRLVEPCNVVAVDERWYLLAWDLRRTDWRTFRIDRIRSAKAAGRRFDPRPVPGEDPAAYVAANLGRAPTDHQVVVVAHADVDAVAAAIPWLADQLEPRGDTACAVTLRANRIDQIAVSVCRLAGRFDLDLPDDVDPAIRAAIDDTTTRLRRLST